MSRGVADSGMATAGGFSPRPGVAPGRDGRRPVSARAMRDVGDAGYTAG